MQNDKHYVPLQLGLVSTILIALVPGITLFLLIPSWVFSYFEGWSYPLAFYYSYVTTTTIGFGDYVPTFQPQQVIIMTMMYRRWWSLIFLRNTKKKYFLFYFQRFYSLANLAAGL